MCRRWGGTGVACPSGPQPARWVVSMWWPGLWPEGIRGDPWRLLGQLGCGWKVENRYWVDNGWELCRCRGAVITSQRELNGVLGDSEWQSLLIPEDCSSGKQKARPTEDPRAKCFPADAAPAPSGAPAGFLACPSFWEALLAACWTLALVFFPCKNNGLHCPFTLFTLSWLLKTKTKPADGLVFWDKCKGVNG